ncbi:MAG: hypothetical protein QM594_16330 [Niabella sp.]
MKRLNRPAKSVVDVLNILKTDTSQKSVFLDIDSIVGILSDRENLYIEKVEDNTLFQIPHEQNIFSSRVNKAKLTSYYKYRLANTKMANGRKFYDEIILSAPQNTCPYCTIRTVKTIDHFLPKGEYPSYSITPANLVPSCTDCNIGKKTSYPTSQDNQTFHPYFDKVDDECWIKAVLKQTEPLSFQYEVIRPAGWDNNKLNRALSHFIGYNINQLFSNEAGRELRGMQHLLKDLFSKDRNILKAHLDDTYNSCLNGLGTLDWKTLMYLELSTNNWFLDGCMGVNFFN